jgi:hypothetical protein
MYTQPRLLKYITLACTCTIKPMEILVVQTRCMQVHNNHDCVDIPYMNLNYGVKARQCYSIFADPGKLLSAAQTMLRQPNVMWSMLCHGARQPT